MRPRWGHPLCGLSFPGLAVPGVVSNVRLVVVRVRLGALGRGGIGFVVLVPRVGIRQETGRRVTIMVTGALTGIRLIVAEGTVAPRRRAIMPIPRAATAGWGPVRELGCAADSAWFLAPHRQNFPFVFCVMIVELNFIEFLLRKKLPPFPVALQCRRKW